MLNELYDLSQSLKAVNVSMESWHTCFKTCPKGTATFYALLDSSGETVDLIPITERERISSIRKWEVAAGVSFPAFNVLPLYEPRDSEAKKTAVDLRKAISSKTPPAPQDIAQRLKSLVADSVSLWANKEPARITKCLTTLASDIAESLGVPPEEFVSISKLIARSQKLNAETLHAQLASLLIRKVVDASDSPVDWFDELIFSSGKTPKRWSLIAELSDRSSFAYPANHERVQSWMNSRFQAIEAISEQTTVANQNEQLDAFANMANRLDDSFPSVRLPKLGDVKLRAMSSESPCQKRYGVADAQSCRVGQLSRQDMKNALEWIGHPDRHQKTWCDVSSLNGVSGALFAYPSQRPETTPELAGLIVGLDAESDPDGALFEQCARRVTIALTEPVRNEPHDQPTTEVRVFVLSKPDGFRTKVTNSGRYSVERLLASANDWDICCRNVPRILIRQFGINKGDKPIWVEPFIPYPAEVVSCLNTAWERAGSHAEQIPGFDIGDALGLLLEDGVVLHSIATRALRTFISNSSSLVLALGQAHRQWRVHQMDKNRKHSLLLPSIFGLLLAKLGRMKGNYMKGPPYMVGRLMSLADQLHVEYCLDERKGQIPTQLFGSALMPTALEQPEQALALLCQRIPPYKNWATRLQKGDRVGLVKFLLGEMGRLCNQLKDCGIPKTADNADKAEMLLGYLASSEKTKEPDDSPPTSVEGATT